MHLLVVDDDSVTRMTLRTVLTSDGHTVVLAADGEDALAKLADVSVDMVISDVHMPGTDGICLRNLVRESPKHKEMPFLFISGYDDKQTVAAVSDPKLEAFFRKGRPLTELLAWVKYLTTPVDERPAYSPNEPTQLTTQRNIEREQRNGTTTQ